MARQGAAQASGIRDAEICEFEERPKGKRGMAETKGSGRLVRYGKPNQAFPFSGVSPHGVCFCRV